MKLIITESQYKKWFLKEDESDEMSAGDMTKEIKRQEKYIAQILPKLIKYFKIKYKDELVKIEVESVPVGFGHANYKTDIPRLEFYFENSLVNRVYDIMEDLRNFDIDMSAYGTPLRIRIYEHTWKLVHG